MGVGNPRPHLNVIDMRKSSATEKMNEQIAAPAPEKKKESAIDPDEKVRVVLRKNPQYQELLVNSRGFVFVPGTSQRIHGDAVLYKNPYYKQNQ